MAQVENISPEQRSACPDKLSLVAGVVFTMFHKQCAKLGTLVRLSWPILDCLGEMGCLDLVAIRKVGDSAGEL
jgi:hypothetical protein